MLSGLAELVVEQIELRLAANIDALTGSMQRRAFMAEAKRDFLRVRRTGRPLACLLIDADRFKAVNDTFGHATGDAVLRHVAAECHAALRESDYLGRLGGEEFCAMLPEAKMSDALAVAERLRLRIAETPLSAGVNTIGVTVSIGIAEAAGSDADVTDLIGRADRAMYEAKARGRNRSHMLIA